MRFLFKLKYMIKCNIDIGNYLYVFIIILLNIKLENIYQYNLLLLI